jgi:hypothetical protein
MASRWQWCTVRTTVAGLPASQTRTAARAAMQSWAWIASKRPASAASPPARVSMDANTRSSSVVPTSEGSQQDRVRYLDGPEQPRRRIAEGNQ